jgi:hypothetical protein
MREREEGKGKRDKNAMIHFQLNHTMSDRIGSLEHCGQKAHLSVERRTTLLSNEQRFLTDFLT